ncbi:MULTISPECIES: S49 family peptidase [unclassified Gilliamella]|uniref:S49 family peptidase n=1 Tax=unclassified Gilliamella TaxID=2685620 RepID=UPI00226ABF74|nr:MULTISPECIES: S49 family peptidase [unclassified Gilliamella]MCX8574528.1 S49 family peptidase [Gilliamella sp. B3831]MCX8576759.1 S49 family peptidase [Gilliamella sp. B3815]MCX8589259.1 S49 family peptidase [Gilliamella sp. B3812]MCX8603833.1 S49 family peptidase [Gilliamella sp. B3823]MCX8606713.1 S49 family peptidase [Gilliamella sp. B3825]
MPKIINYPHLANQVFGVPHYATRQTLDAVKAVIIPRMLSDSLSLSDLDNINLSTKPEATKVTSNANPVKVIPIHGLLTTRRGSINAACTELVSYERLRNDINQALSDDSIKEIVLDINSGGGSATGCKELADFIYQSRDIKPITAIVNFYAFSAAYFIAAACSKIVLSQTSGVGSIGVIWEHMEASKLEENAGLKFTTIYRGDFKNAGSMHEPLSENALTEINAQLDWMYNLFTQSVAQYRNIDIQKIIDTQARCFFGADAISAGLADEVQNPQDAINAIASTYQQQTQSNQRNIKIRAQAINQTARI